MSDKKDFDFEETKSTIVDYFVLFKHTRMAIIFILVISTILFFAFYQTLFNVAETFRDLGIVFTRASEPFTFDKPLDAAFAYSMVGVVITPGIIAPIAWLFWKTIVKGRKLEKYLINFQSDLIRKSYLINFELVEPEIIIQGGDPRLEKFVNHLSLVFTDINQKNKKRLEKGKTVEQFWVWKKNKFSAWKDYFFMTPTILGSYVVQSYESKVTIEDVKTVIKKVNLEKNLTRLGLGQGVSYRVIILGKEFDESFSNDNILITMNELKRKFRIDIILETEYGYSTIWID